MAQVTDSSPEHLSQKNSQLNACSRARRDASITIAFRDVDEKRSGISLGKVDSR